MTVLFFKKTCQSSVTTLAIILAVVLSPLHDQQAMGADRVPEGSLAFASIDLVGLKYAKEFQLIERLMGHVSTEASMVSVKNFGLDVTAISDLVIAVAPLEKVMSSKAPAACVEFNFLKSFRSSDIIRRLGKDWKRTELNNNTYYTNADKCIFISSKSSLVAGPPEVVQWFVESETDSVELTGMLDYNSENSHFSVAVDMRQVPPQLIQAFAGEMAQNLAGVEFLETTVSFDEALFVSAYAHCVDGGKAKDLGQELKNLVAEGIDQLVALDEQTMAKVSDAPASEAFESIAFLAAIREAIQVVEETDVDVAEDLTSVTMIADSQLLFALPAVAAIGAMGQSAQESFHRTSQQLSESELPAEQPEQKETRKQLRSGYLNRSGLLK